VEDYRSGIPTQANEDVNGVEVVGLAQALSRVETRRKAEVAAGTARSSEEDLIWIRLLGLGRAVLQLIEQRQKGNETNGDEVEADRDSLPPRYSLDEYQHQDDRSSLPDYEDHVNQSSLLAESKSSASHDQGNGNGHKDEKMMNDLDDVTSAIERLHRVAPQLNNQRAERRVEAGPSRMASANQARARLERDKMRELEEIWKKIERAHMKRGVRERVDLEGYEARRAERVSGLLSRGSFS
jgi:hypothetical protein